MVMKESTIKKHLKEALLELQTNCEPKANALINLIAKHAQLTDCLDKYKKDLALSQQDLSEVKQCLDYELERLEKSPDSKWGESMVNQYCEKLKTCIEIHDNYPMEIAKTNDLIDSTMQEISRIVQSKDRETICAKNPLIMGIIKMFLSKDLITRWVHGNYAILRFGLESWENCGDDKVAYYFPLIHFPITKKGKVNPRKITFHFRKIIISKLHNHTGMTRLESSLVNIKTDVHLDFDFIMTSIHQNTKIDKELLQYLIQSKTSIIQFTPHSSYYCNDSGLQESFYTFSDELNKKEE